MLIIEIPHGTEAYEELRWAISAGDVAPAYMVRIAIDDDTVKIKRNEDTWSPPLEGATIRKTEG